MVLRVMCRVLALGCTLSLALAGCSGGEFESLETPSCGTDPTLCIAPQTCWVNSAGNAMQCLNAGSGALGESCMLYPGTATCRAGLICVDHVCQPICSATAPGAGCAAGLCRPVRLSAEADPLFSFCDTNG